MPDFVTLSCPSCGGKLQITSNIERFACGYCGNEHVVSRGGGIISLIPVAEDIKGIKTGVDKTAAELAIPRIKKEIEEIESDHTFNKRRILSTKVNKNGELGITASIFLKRTGRFKISAFDLKKPAEIFTSLSDEDINYSLTHWKEFWNRKGLEMLEVISVYNVLTDVKKLMDEKEETIHQREAELEKMQQIVNS